MTLDFKYKLLSTEKSFLLRSNGKIVLATNSSITKKDVIVFIENKYDAKVLKINSLVAKGKNKIRRKISVKLSDKKKFYITLDNLEKFEKIEKNNVEAV